MMEEQHAASARVRPVVLTHTSLLVQQVLSRALEIAGVDARRTDDGLTDVLRVGENVHDDVHLGPAGISPRDTVGDLVEAVRRAAEGRPPQLARPVDPVTAEVDLLTEREREVLVLLSTGATNDSMAIELGISPHTVRTHVQNLLGKLGVQNRLAAAAVARRHGLLPVGAG